MRKVAWVIPLLLAGCSAEAPVEPLQTEAVPVSYTHLTLPTILLV